MPAVGAAPGERSPLKKMPQSIVAPIRRLRVDPVQLPHPLRQIALHRFDHEMIVVGHEAERMADPVVTFHHLRQHTQKRLTILIVLENRLSPIASGGDVVQGSGKLNAQGSGHVPSLARDSGCYNARTDPVFLVIVPKAKSFSNGSPAIPPSTCSLV